MKPTTFSAYHPGIILGYLIAALLTTMITLHPVCTAISAVCASFNLVLLQRQKAVRPMIWAAIMGLFVAILNPLYNGRGLTVLFFLFGHPVTQEALLYGACSGGMLYAVILWFSCYSALISSEKFLFLFGRAFPTGALLLSTVLRFLPESFRRARQASDAQTALLGGTHTQKQRLRHGLRASTVLFGWCLESSLQTADSMRARGYGTAQRTHFAPYRFCMRDGAMLCILCALLCGALYGIFQWANAFTFYPVLSCATLPWWIILMQVFLLSMPLLLEGRDCIRWRLSRY